MNINKTNTDEVIINFNYALGSKTFFFSVTKSGGYITGMKRRKIGQEPIPSLTESEVENLLLDNNITFLPVILLDDLCHIYLFEEPDGDGFEIEDMNYNAGVGDYMIKGNLYMRLKVYHYGKKLKFR